jgi:uncharacterized protein YjiS (DUF1127 family)
MSDRPMTLSFLVERETGPRRGWTGPKRLSRVAAPAFRPSRASIIETARLAWRRHRSRVRLAELDGRLLKDIGVTYAEAEHEANKPFWRG